MDKAIFETELERQIFMGINVARFAPKNLYTLVKEVYRTSEAASRARGIKSLLAQLQNLPRLPPVIFDPSATQACRRNNEQITKMNLMIDGGNVVAYNKIADEPCMAEEFTLRNF